MSYTIPPDLTEAEQAVFHAAAFEPVPRESENPELATTPDLTLGSDTLLDLDEEVAARMPGVVGLQGKPGAGKDTVAWIAALGLGAAGRRARVIGTSDPVIIEANAYLSEYDRVVGHGNKSWLPYRRLLQTLGETRRRGDPTYWNRAHYANLARIRAAEIEAGNGDPVIFITGLRTPSDLDLIQGPPLAAPAVRVYRSGNPYQADHWIERQLDHVQDQDFQFVIHNNENDVVGLYEQVRRMCISLSGL